jgi:hypothetical protein
MATVTIVAPSPGANVVQPVTAMGTVTPGTSVVKAFCIGSDGSSHSGTPATLSGPNWTFFFQAVPPGAAVLTISLADGTNPVQIDINVTSPP